VANISIARGVAAELGLQPSFIIIGMRDGERCYIDDPDVSTFVMNSRSLLSPGGSWRIFKQLDCVLDIGGGDSFAEIYGAKRFGFLWLSKMMAIARKKPLLLSPQTIGPFTSAPYKLAARIAMERATAVVARDRPSLDVLQALAPKANAVLATDVAFALPFEDRSRERGEGRLKVGLNISGLLFTDAEAGVNHFALDFNYAELMRRLIDGLRSRPDVDLHFFAHVAASDNPTDDDARVIERIARDYPGVHVEPAFGSPSEAKSYISSLDFVVSGRMHACIGAFSAGVPVVPISYSRKFAGLFGSLGYEWLVPTTGMSTSEATEFILSALDKRETLRSDAAKAMQLVSGLLDRYRAELAQLFLKASN
jgi:polysaccharide pyruvyl transferase WcaK-like protein